MRKVTRYLLQAGFEEEGGGSHLVNYAETLLEDWELGELKYSHLYFFLNGCRGSFRTSFWIIKKKLKNKFNNLIIILKKKIIDGMPLQR